MLVRFDRDHGEFDDREFNNFWPEQNIVRINKEFINCSSHYNVLPSAFLVTDYFQSITLSSAS